MSQSDFLNFKFYSSGSVVYQNLQLSDLAGFFSVRAQRYTSRFSRLSNEFAVWVFCVQPALCDVHVCFFCLGFRSGIEDPARFTEYLLSESSGIEQNATK